MKISTILDQIDSGSIALPEFQRGYVWNRNQVRRLMRALYKGYPVGSLLMWETKTEDARARGKGTLAPGVVNLLLDGQQRITTLYGIIRGKPPQFFDGDASTFTGLYFNLDTEEFEFYAPIKMRDDPCWISVTELMQAGFGKFYSRIKQLSESPDMEAAYVDRLNAITSIKDRELHTEIVTGQDKSIDVVVEIFNEVNSGGTKLSKGDLALAKICASWPGARPEMKQSLEKWERAGFSFKLDWLLRCITTVATGEALFTALADISIREFRAALGQAEKYIDDLLNLIASRLGLDHDRVLGSRYSFPLLVRYLHQRGGRLSGQSERDRLLYWYIHTLLWGRYSGSTESTLTKDLAAIQDNTGALERLIEQLRQDRGDLQIHPRDFEDWSRSSRFYPMLYMMTRVWHARDWESGIELSSYLLGRLSTLQVHHIFPKALLYEAGYKKSEVNAIANFTFLTQQTNLQVSDRDPAEYLEEFARKNPGVIESHWIPLDRSLWKVENYREFLAARRELLAQAANQFLNSLWRGTVPEPEFAGPVLERLVVSVPGRLNGDEEEKALRECNEWVKRQNLAEGEYAYELVDDQSKEILTYFDLAWPDGLQPGFSQPVALLLNESEATHALAQRAGFRFFTSVDDLKSYVRKEILGEISPVDTDFVR